MSFIRLNTLKFLSILSFIFAQHSFSCQEHLIADSHNQPDAAEYHKRLAEVHDIADKLGLLNGIKKHIVELLNPSSVAGMAAVNRYPVGSWSDGAAIFNQARNLQGVLEFVLSGHSTQHSYYLSNLSPILFMNILAHVYGHNFFHVNSYFKHKTSHDRVGVSVELDELMTDIGKYEDPREVEDWFFHLLSLEMAQDVWSGAYVEPKDLKADRPIGFNQWRDGLVQTSQSSGKQTVSLLQAFVSELPSDIAPWKLEMAKKFEKMNRFIPGAVNTKLLNEGFAMLVEEIIFSHHPDYARSFGDAAEIGMLAGRVARPSLTNPYFLGLEIWREIREEFNRRPENIKLEGMERDQKFINYAREIINNPNLGNNVMFIFSKLTDQWIKNRHLALVKKFSNEEKFQLAQQGAPLPQDYMDGTLYQVITHDPERIRYQVQQDWNLSYAYPRVVWNNLHNQTDDVAKLSVSNEMGYFTPINRKTVAPTLLSWAKILRKTVELEATLIIDVIKEVTWDWFSFKPKMKVIGYRLARAKIRVNPEGQINVSTLKKMEILDSNSSWEEGIEIHQTPSFREWTPEAAEKSTVDKEIYGHLFKNLREFLIDYHIDQTEVPKGIVSTLKNKEGIEIDPLGSIYKNINDVVGSMALNEVPHGILKALNRYHQKVAERFLAAFSKAANNGGLTRTGSGYSLKVLPEVGGIVFDRRAQNGIKRLLSKVNDLDNNPFVTDDGLLLQPQGLKDKEYYVEKSSNQPGDGNDGDGEGDGEPDEGSDEDSDTGKPSNGQGCGGGDPSYIEIPLELYQSLIKDEVELPNLRPLKGQTEQMRKIFVGSQPLDRKPYVAKKIVRDAIKLGLGVINLREEEGEDTSELDPFEVGVDFLQKKNIHSKNHRQQPDPDISAHVTIISDLSGSMMGYVEKMKEIIFNIRSLLKHKYKNIVFTYVAFDGVAYDFDEAHENDFYKVQLGGGTDYGVGAAKALEVQAKFPDSEYDRFTFMFGDLIADLSDSAQSNIEKVMGNSRFFGTINFTAYSEEDALGQFLIGKAKMDNFVGYQLISEEEEKVNVVKLLRKLFKTENKKKK
ncbi:MAG: SpoVR family protein [Proteobacteria bacterium]|nr:SpoVR family protein [Pseudomonadota bacterium]